jgi:vacuolar-type H+-ATPase subunit F/Vma7
VKKIIFITPEDAELGFSLAGIRQIIVPEGGHEEALLSALEEPDTGIIAIEERVYQRYDRERLKHAESGWGGLITVFPAPEAVGIGAEEYLAELVKRAVGYHMRLAL